MSSPSPLQNQDHLAAAASPKSRVQITVLTILALHVVVIGGLLLQGCDKKGAQTAGATNTTSSIVSSLPPLGDANTNYFSAFPGDAAGRTPPGAGTPADTGHAAGTPPNPAQPSGGGAPGSTLPPLVPSNPAPQNNATETAANGVGSAPAGGNPPAAGGAPAAHPGEHVIKSGDIIAEIAKKYGVTAQAILEANPGVNPRKLKVESKLHIPAPKPAVAKAAGNGSTPAGNATGPAAPEAGVGDVYIVQQGDNLARIAKKYGITVNQLRTANKIKGDRITPKQRLVIPTKSVPTPAPAAGGAPVSASSPA